MPPSAIVVVPMGDVSSPSLMVVSSSTQVILEATSMAIPGVVLMDSSTFASVLGEPCRPAQSPLLCPHWDDCLLRLCLSLPLPLPFCQLSPLGSVVDRGGVARPRVHRSSGPNRASRVVLLVWLVEGDEAEVEEWWRFESAPLRADVTLETINRMFSGLRDVVLIARTLVTRVFFLRKGECFLHGRPFMTFFLALDRLFSLLP